MANARSYMVYIDGEMKGEFTILGPSMTCAHVRTLRARDGVKGDHKPFIDNKEADDNTIIMSNAKVEFISGAASS